MSVQKNDDTVKALQVIGATILFLVASGLAAKGVDGWGWFFLAAVLVL